jgi:transposase-like protein
MAKQEQLGFKKFCEKYPDEAACHKQLKEMRWPNGFVCPRCGCTDCYDIPTRQKHQCKKCRYQVSVTSGTVMHRSHLPLTTWFWAIYLVASDKRGYSASQLSRQLELPYSTAWFLLHRIRDAMGQRDAEYLLSGLVELDDTYFGGPTSGGKRGRGTDKTKVMAAVSLNEKGKPQFLKMQVVPNLRGKTIGAFAQSSIVPNSTIQSDALLSYRKPLAEKYLHQYNVFDPQSDLLHWLHTLVGNAKAAVNGTFHGLAPKHLQRYLDEFCFRFNRRFFNGNIFFRLLNSVACSQPCPLSALS